ncbi:hypothetical protein FCN18_37855, partial [Prauserella endophytica]
MSFCGILPWACGLIGPQATLPAETAPNGVVRTMTKSVGRQGLEPWTQGLKARGFDRGDLETAFDCRASTCG